jgi:hypothetical protein
LPYKKLYRLRQDTDSDWQPRQWYKDDALNISWVADIAIKASDKMPIEGLRGFIVRHHPEMDGLRHQYTIAVAEGLPLPMERFVVIKELMHCYFSTDNGCSTDSQMALEAHVRQFFGGSARSQSLHVQAEYKALWMAMGVLCPEQRRLVYRREFQQGDISIPQLAEKLKAPEHIVRRLLSDQFEDEIREIIN